MFRLSLENANFAQYVVGRGNTSVAALFNPGSRAVRPFESPNSLSALIPNPDCFREFHSKPFVVAIFTGLNSGPFIL